MGCIPICCKLETKRTTDDQVLMFVILKIDEAILGDSKMRINIFIYKLFEMKFADQSAKLLGTKVVLEMSVHNLKLLCPTLM